MTTRDGRVSFRLPPEYSTLASATGEVWVLPIGTFAYRYAAPEQRWYDSLLAAPSSPSRGWCTEQIGGVPTLIQYTYASPATGAGHYLQGIAPVERGRKLRLIGFAHDTTRAGVLLEITRGTRLQNAKRTP